MIKFKMIFVGDQSVGKTSIINRFVSDKFSEVDKVVKFSFFDEILAHSRN